MEKNRMQFLRTDGCEHPQASDIFTPFALHSPPACGENIMEAEVSVYYTITQMKNQ